MAVAASQGSTGIRPVKLSRRYEPAWTVLSLREALDWIHYGDSRLEARGRAKLARLGMTEREAYARAYGGPL